MRRLRQGHCLRDESELLVKSAAGGTSDPLLTRLSDELAPELTPVRRIGGGAATRVYLAREPALRRLVTVKVLAPDLAGDERARLRFQREAQAAARISHPGVVAVYRVGRLSDGLPYAVMQYVPGKDLESRIQAEGPLPVDEARALLADIAAALGAAHARGIVHRDIRPANILFDAEAGRALVSDFGIAAILVSGEEEPVALTTVGHVLGETAHMSPERLRGEDATEESDVYSLGIVGYELLTGGGPYGVESEPDLVSAHLEGQPRPLAELRPDADRWLGELLLRCLAKRPEHRPRAADVARLLEEGGAGAVESGARGGSPITRERGPAGSPRPADADRGAPPRPAPARVGAPVAASGVAADGEAIASPSTEGAAAAAGFRAPAGAFELRVLGDLELRNAEGRPVMSVLAQPKRVALLAFLAIRGGGETSGFERRDSIVGVFWPELDEERGRHALRQAIYVLRRALGGEALPSRADDEVAVDPELLWCDAAAFETAASRGSDAAAMELYRGALLPGFFLPDASGFERWLEGERRRLAGLASETAWRLSAGRESSGDAVGAARWARRAAELVPFDEGALQRLLEALTRLGDRAGALQAYQGFERRLASEFDAEPDPRTRELVRAIRND